MKVAWNITPVWLDDTCDISTDFMRYIIYINDWVQKALSLFILYMFLSFGCETWTCINGVCDSLKSPCMSISFMLIIIGTVV